MTINFLQQTRELDMYNYYYWQQKHLTSSPSIDLKAWELSSNLYVSMCFGASESFYSITEDVNDRNIIFESQSLCFRFVAFSI